MLRDSSKLSNKMTLFAILLAVYTMCDTEAARSKTKPGLLAAAQVNGASTSKSKASSSGNSYRTDHSSDANATDISPQHALKNYLMTNYDSSLRPVLNHTDSIILKVGFTFRQILDLDEKNQILKSLVWFRMTWTDQYLTWNPDDYDGLNEIEVAYNSIWRPDIVVYEEIGIRDYSPRLQKAKVSYDGTVKYNEPNTFETTCSINTAFFPFDVQVCEITFVSWTETVNKIDLSSDRDSTKLFEDTKSYFVNTGEWRLVGMRVGKIVRDYGQLLSSNSPNHTSELESLQASEHFSNATYVDGNDDDFRKEEETQHLNREHAAIHKTLYPMSAQDLTNFTTLGNTSVKDSMFSEIKFTIVVRRNSSLYMQSMLFPSILLTTVAILGFYLPPDSGERIGLQITILLTFMVFLLAVGEMFPASTGPYLSVYFVLCMGLLGINLAMTVIVLHLHFKPLILRDPKLEKKLKKTYYSNQNQRNCFGYCIPLSYDEESSDMMLKKRKMDKSVVPKRLRKFLKFCDRYWSLKEYNARWLYYTTDDENDESAENDDLTDDEGTFDDEESATSDYYERRDTLESRNNRLKLEKQTCSENHTPDVQHKSPQPKIVKDSLELPPTEHEPYQRYEKSLSESHLPNLGAKDATKMSNKTKPSKSPTIFDQSFDAVGINMLAQMTLSGLSKQQENGTKHGIKHSLSAVSTISDGKYGYKNKGSTSHKRNPRHTEPVESTTILRNKFIGAINDLKGFMKKSEKMKRKSRTKQEQKAKLQQKQKEKEQERQDMEQEEWKSVARAIDIIFFRTYIFLIVVTHTSLFGIALKTWFSDHRLNDLKHIV